VTVEPESETVVLQVLSDWLAQYARFLRRAPGVLDNLGSRDEEFEVVAVPRLLLDRLAVPGIGNSGGLGDWTEEMDRIVALATGPQPTPEAPRGHSGERVVEALCRAIEDGDAAAALALFSPAFVDEDGRRLRDMRGLLDRVIADTETRRLVVSELELEPRSAGEVSIRVHGRWSADEVTEELDLRLTIARDAFDEWRIIDLRLA
jgi:hypothetical protein